MLSVSDYVDMAEGSERAGIEKVFREYGAELWSQAADIMREERMNHCDGDSGLPPNLLLAHIENRFSMLARTCCEPTPKEKRK